MVPSGHPSDGRGIKPETAQSTLIMWFVFHLRSSSSILQLAEEHLSGHVALHDSSINNGIGFRGPLDATHLNSPNEVYLSVQLKEYSYLVLNLSPIL